MIYSYVNTEAFQCEMTSSKMHRLVQTPMVERATHETNQVPLMVVKVVNGD